MEACIQCGKQQSQPFGVVAIMNMEHAPDPTAAIAENGLWMAFPICSDCHRAPKLKAHYVPREYLPEFLIAVRDQILL